MRHFSRMIAAGALACLVTAPISLANATENKGHDHSSMKAPKDTDQAEALGVINSVDADKRSVNVTHEPVEALGWPKMTMDLPVTRRVDLSAVKTGAKVRFKLKQGRDKQFRIISVENAE